MHYLRVGTIASPTNYHCNVKRIFHFDPDCKEEKYPLERFWNSITSSSKAILQQTFLFNKFGQHERRNFQTEKCVLACEGMLTRKV